jgi:photosynthetic reaction center H subunit
MGTGAITQYIDVAQLVLYAFWIFFAGLIYYLVRESHREGYPMETENGRGGKIGGWPVPPPKIFKTEHGDVVVPDPNRDKRPLALEPMHRWNGAPLEPTGNPLLDGVGPGAWAERADTPDVNPEGQPKILPLRVASAYGVARQDVDPRGLPVVGADGVTGGIVRDMWLDTSEMVFRYIEIEVAGGRHVLLPVPFARIKRDKVKVAAVFGHHFADVPATKSPDQVTLLEEEKIVAYYGGGLLYADPQRQEPLV